MHDSALRPHRDDAEGLHRQDHLVPQPLPVCLRPQRRLLRAPASNELDLPWVLAESRSRAPAVPDGHPSHHLHGGRRGPRPVVHIDGGP
eukprot:1006589-Pyramimonas_sp.AAC.1